MLLRLVLEGCLKRAGRRSHLVVRLRHLGNRLMTFMQE